MRARGGNGVQEAKVVGGRFAQADAAKTGLLDGGNLFAGGVIEFEAGGQRMRRAAFQADTGRGRLAGVGAQRQASDLGGHEGNALPHGGVVAQQLNNQLEGAVEQGGVQVRGAQLGGQAGVGLQHRQYAGVGFNPAVGHGAEGRAVVQPHRACQRVVRRAGEVWSARGQAEFALRQAGAAGLAQQAAAGVLDPGLGAVGVFGGDAEAPVGVVQQQAGQLAGRRIQQQRGVDFQFFKFGVVAGLPMQRGG
ncbi:hypothetical protein D3C71_1457540 [compost metagenome]